MADESANDDPVIEYARVRLLDFYRTQRFRDAHRGESLFILVFMSGILGAFILCGLFLLTAPVWMIPSVSRFTEGPAWIAATVGLLLVASAFAFWIQYREWQREKDALVRQTRTDSDFDIALRYLWYFKPFYISDALGHELEVLLRMKKIVEATVGPRDFL